MVSIRDILIQGAIGVALSITILVAPALLFALIDMITGDRTNLYDLYVPILQFSVALSGALFIPTAWVIDLILNTFFGLLRAVGIPWSINSDLVSLVDKFITQINFAVSTLTSVSAVNNVISNSSDNEKETNVTTIQDLIPSRFG